MDLLSKTSKSISQAAITKTERFSSLQTRRSNLQAKLNQNKNLSFCIRRDQIQVPLPRTCYKKIQERKENRGYNKKSSPKGQENSVNSTSLRVKSQLTMQNSRFLTSIEPSQTPLQRYQSSIGPLLNKFSQIKEKKVYQNHSSTKKDSGVVINSASLLNKMGFHQTKHVVYKPFLTIDKSNKKKKLPRFSQSSENHRQMGQQLSKEKKMFLKFHPSLEERENVRLLNEQVERKKNIKKLEQLFLEQTSKITNQIYT